jgi:uncharacterized protein
MKKYSLLIGLALSMVCTAVGAAPMKALILDGQNNHDWKGTTPVLKRILEESGLFSVDVLTSPPQGADMSGFKPNFSGYKVIVSNYNGDSWPRETREAFVQYMQSGGGLVVQHASDNSFPDWKEYNEMIGLGGWNGRNEKSGPYVRFIDGKIVRDTSPGSGGSHGQQHAFLVECRNPEHPIMRGVPAKWLHAKDELYDRMRGPAVNLDVLATAYSDKAKGGSGFNEPMLLTVTYGQGRIFHTMMGHDAGPIQCVGFITTFQRGTEWAATGKVTQKVPADFPTEVKTSSRAK